MPDYGIRPATLDDLDILVSHRLAMFTEMGTPIDAPVIRQLFRDWLLTMMPAGEYRAWVCQTEAGDTVAGAGLTLLRWPPGPSAVSGEPIAFVYNVYTEPGHRKQGLARRLMETIHTWHAPSPMMWKILQLSDRILGPEAKI